MLTAFRSEHEGEGIARARPAVHPEDPPDEGSLYLDALRELQRLEGEVLRLIATIQKAAKNLDHWQAVHVTNAGVGFPMEVTMVGRSIDAATWPTGRQLADTVAAWHEAAEVVRTKWGRLSRETRSRMPPP
jgi:hypothetical protein